MLPFRTGHAPSRGGPQPRPPQVPLGHGAQNCDLIPPRPKPIANGLPEPSIRLAAALGPLLDSLTPEAIYIHGISSPGSGRRRQRRLDRQGGHGHVHQAGHEPCRAWQHGPPLAKAIEMQAEDAFLLSKQHSPLLLPPRQRRTRCRIISHPSCWRHSLSRILPSSRSSNPRSCRHRPHHSSTRFQQDD